MVNKPKSKTLNTKIYPKLWVSALSLFLVCSLHAQDIHFSQFGNSPLNLNPALTGQFEGDYRFRANYRNQWNVPIPYNTVSGSFEKSFCTVNCGESVSWRAPGLSLGALFNYDVAGDGKLSTAQLEVAGSYTGYLASRLAYSAGLMVGGGQRSFNQANLFFDSQYDGKGFDPNLPNGEDFDNTTKFVFDVSAGLNLHYGALNNRSAVDFGLGVFHLNQPKANFYNSTDKRLPSRFAVYGMAAVELSSRFDLLVNALGQFQGPYQEILLGPGLRIHLQSGNLPGRPAVDVGLHFRLNDAVIPYAGLAYRMWLFGISYDINTSGFRQATGGNGGPEFSLGYTIYKPKPVKICPIQL